MAEERDVPTLDELVIECDTIAANLDKTYPPGAEVSGADVMSELKNTILPLIKDVAASAMLDIGEIQDDINPVKLTRADADEAAILLKAYAASNPTDAGLQGRIAAQLEALEDGDDEEDEEETETN
jgi:hypothetical protein